MKTALTSLLATALLLGTTALATAQDVYRPGILCNGGTNSVPTLSTNTLTRSFSVASGEDVALLISGKADAACSGTVDFKFAESVDNVLFETTPTHTVTVTLNGTNVVTKVSHLNVKSSGYLRLQQTVNTNAQSATNLVIKFGVKRP